ncbi:PqiC family protein [Sedimentitalea sp. JM2-8]|uniref:PqiC family protein n=1 Tax=Sedimentitalea xiamensis TaxID=3050037 RepID=A0ABT7FGX0_9RHOB|nr:PqiC family protein [Sedimentitalea xiamensis]MDK3074389.1 PqiC family protein [Sedimentitalea xiamensis]
MTACFPARLMLLLSLAVAACGDNSARFLLDTPPPQQKTGVRVSTIEIRDVTLPAYAAASEIMVQSEDGALRPVSQAVWADDPVRAVTLSLARDLEAVSTATVSTEPWPLADPAQVRIDVRLDRMVARNDGQFQLAGQFAIAAPDGAVRESINRFDIMQPIAGDTPDAIARATSSALLALARQIAARLGR